MLVQAIAVKFGGGAQGAQVGLAGFTNPQQAVQFNPEQNTQGPFVPQTTQETTGTPNKTAPKMIIMISITFKVFFIFLISVGS